MIKTAAILFGIVFLLIGILGFVPAADTWLHVVLAVAMLFLGFGASGSKATV